MHLSRSLSLMLSLLALPIAVACGDDAGTGTMPTTSSTVPATPPSTPPVAPSNPPAVPSNPPAVPSNPPAVPTNPPAQPPATDHWTTVYPIFQSKCNQENNFCHANPGGLPPYLFGESDAVKTAAEASVDRIIARTAVDAPSPMPRPESGLVLTETERAALEAWAESLN